ncbi:hypothetical protein AB4865_11625 [Capnocytophaga sp. ARDL2]|uniref:hypothetical protein n=1 Tax=Capnocytophaga sp. ARDL2 TaxID=3238809 RepID=UPI003558C99F
MNSKEENQQIVQQKSWVKRFVFFVGILFLLLYIVLGGIFIFWKDMPYFDLSYNQRLWFGIILWVYSVIRFFRILSQRKDL